MNKSLKEKEWVRLNNGNLIMFLHHHLPFLQAKSKVEWNALGDFLLFLDKIITSNSDSSRLSFKVPRKEIAKFNTGKHFNTYLEHFFVDERFYYTLKKSNEVKNYCTLMYLSEFIKEAQKYLIDIMGIEEYLTPLKINLANVIEKDTYSIPFNKFKFLNMELVEIGNLVSENSPLSDSIRKTHPIILTPNYIQTQVDSFVSVFKQKDLINFYGFTEREARKAVLSVKSFTFETKKDTKQTKVFSKSDLKNEIYTKVVLNKDEVSKLLVETSIDSLTLSSIYALKQYYVDNSNFAVYKEANIRLYTLLRANIFDFQGCTRELRKKLFKGLWQYDLNVAAPTILYQLFKEHFPTRHLKTLVNYIKDKNTFRYECAEYLMTTFEYDKDKAYADVKELITALFYGATALNPRSELSLSLDKRKSLIENVPMFKELITETNILFNDLYGYYITNCKEDKINLDGFLINIYKKDKKGRLVKKSKASILSSVYFFYERTILEIVRNKYEDLTLMIHDGFIITHKIDKRELEIEIYNKLGFMVNYSEEQL
ncbi:MAG: hypothetical protein PHV52_05065 [Aliarcobacter sp.]|nr:hypothetical protein [Aliarcobacter sp.]